MTNVHIRAEWYMSHTTLSHHNTCMRNTVTFYIVQAGELCCWAREESTEVSEYGGACCLDVEQCLASGTANRNHKHWLRATLGAGMTGCYSECGNDKVLYTLSHMEHCHFWYHQKVTWSALVVLTFYMYINTCKSIHVLWITLHGFKCT